MNNWELVDGASWLYPLGDSNLIAYDNHPVTQVSWNDAIKSIAYCEFCDKTLPTEVQWEYAASERGKREKSIILLG